MTRWTAEQYRAWRARRRAEGGCIRCRRPAVPGRSKCAYCARLHADEALYSWRRRKGLPAEPPRRPDERGGEGGRPPGHAERLARYEARAAAGLPIFEEGERG